MADPRAIVARTGKPTALIVDEAQQALATTVGIDAMFALKAARDALNQDIVWRNGRSAYALEDQCMVEWFRAWYRRHHA